MSALEEVEESSKRRFRLVIFLMIGYAAIDSMSWANQWSTWKTVARLEAALGIDQELMAISVGIDQILGKLADDRRSTR